MFVPSALTSTATEAPCGSGGGGARGLAERVLGPSASAAGAGETHRGHCELGQARGHEQLLWLVNELRVQSWRPNKAVDALHRWHT